MIQLDFTEFTLRSGYDPDEVNTLWGALLPNGLLAGGAIRRAISGINQDSDYDFFFKGESYKDSFCEALTSDHGFVQVRKTQHHTEFKGKIKDRPTVVQAIHFDYFDGPKDLLEAFDFTICQFAYNGVHLFTTPEALWDLARKRLVINKVTYPVSTLRRMIKYTKQGYYACGGCMKEFLNQTRLLEDPDLDTTYVD